MASSRSVSPPVDDDNVLSISEFSEIVHQSLRAMFPDGIWIEGEVEGLRPTNKHAYFSLIENTADGSKAVLSVNVWAREFASITAKLRKHGVELKNGLKVRFFGRPQFYAPQGKLSFIVSDVDTQFSVGDVAKKREELIQRLKDTGLVRRNKSLAVPTVPLRLGIVSSAQAAGWADARKHLVESGFGFSILFCDVRVQGDEAVDTVSAAIRTLGARDDIDVILVMRGGGSKSDLAAFDEEKVAMAIVRCPKPVFTGIGHEIDISVADIVAHTSCKTPTACADEVIGYVQEFVNDVSSVAQQVRTRTQSALALSRERISRSIERLANRSRRALEGQAKDLERVMTKVELLDPIHTMSRGWSITRDARGNVVRSVRDVAQGDILVTTVADGDVTSTVGKP